MTLLVPGDSLVATYFNVSGSTKNFVITCGIAASGAPPIGTVVAAWRLSTTGAGGPFQAAVMKLGWTMTKVYGLQNSGGVMTSFLDPTPIAGTDAIFGSPAPNTSVLVEKLTSLAGVRYRGRMSVPPCNLDEAAISQAGIIDTSPLGVQQGYWNHVFSTLTAGGYNPYLFHAPSKPGTVHPSAVPVRTPVVSFRVAAMVGTNRRRLR